jgi:hypothetical protein
MQNEDSSAQQNAPNFLIKTYDIVSVSSLGHFLEYLMTTPARVLSALTASVADRAKDVSV